MFIGNGYFALIPEIKMQVDQDSQDIQIVLWNCIAIHSKVEAVCTTMLSNLAYSVYFFIITKCRIDFQTDGNLIMIPITYTC